MSDRTEQETRQEWQDRQVDEVASEPENARWLAHRGMPPEVTPRHVVAQNLLTRFQLDLKKKEKKLAYKEASGDFRTSVVEQQIDSLHDGINLLWGSCHPPSISGEPYMEHFFKCPYCPEMVDVKRRYFEGMCAGCWRVATGGSPPPKDELIREVERVIGE